MQLKLSHHVTDGVLIIECNGRVVFGEEAAALRELVKTMLAQHKNIVLDLHNVSYIDSGGLGMLVGLYTSAHGANGEIRLARLTQKVDQLLQVTKLATVFECHDSVESAVKAAAKAAGA